MAVVTAVVGLAMIVGGLVLAWRRGPGPRRRQWARVVWVVCIFAFVSNVGQPPAQRIALFNDAGVLGGIGLGVGLLWTRGRRQARGTWP